MNGTRKFLLASGTAVIAIGLLYGVSPSAVLEGIVGLSLQDNELHIFRAIMGLYCGIGGLLLVGALYAEHAKAALLLESVFLGGLAAGRLISLAVDGNFHWFALLAVSIEVPLFIVCLLLLNAQAKAWAAPSSPASA